MQGGKIKLLSYLGTEELNRLLTLLAASQLAHSYRTATALAVLSPVSMLKKQAKDTAGAWDKGCASWHFDKNPPQLCHIILLLVQILYAHMKVL